MTSREYVAAEVGNTDRIILYREGLFWRAYERSAFALCTQVKAFKPTRKVLKTLDGADLISAGFPIGGEDNVLRDLRCIAREADKLTFAARRPVVEKEFRAWKATIPLSGRRVESSRGVVSTSSDSRAAMPPTPTTRETDSGLRQQAASVAQARDLGRGTTAYPPRPVTTQPSQLRRMPFDDDEFEHSDELELDFGQPAASAATSAPTLPPTLPVYGEADFSLSAACRVADALRHFNLADKTPMECMIFVSEMQKLLVDYK